MESTSGSSGRLGREENTSGDSNRNLYGCNVTWPGAGSTGFNGFFIPTYLKGSKYIEQLESSRRAKQAARKEAASLSRSSSTTSLPRLAPSHRGMTYEIIERPPPKSDDTIPPLPTKWGEVDRYGGLEIAAEGKDVKYVGMSKMQDHEAVAARADCPIPSRCGIYYYEVTINSRGKDGMIGVGFSGAKASLEKLPGWESESWAYHGDDGKIFSCAFSTGKAYGPSFTTGDVVGCGINFMNGTAFFTRNGVKHDLAFENLKDIGLYPSVGMKRPQAHLSANFGQVPFVFDIDGFVKGEKFKAKGEIASTSIDEVQPSLDEAGLTKELVTQYLIHEGYVETAKAFATEVDSETVALGDNQEATSTRSTTADDLDATNRQQIRAAILGGDIDKALKRTHAYYPRVLQDSSQIYFRLRCRRLVEMFRQISELRDPPVERRGKSLNGGHPTAEDDDDGVELEPDMELDGQLQSTEDMDIEVNEFHGKLDTLLQAAVEYGRELREEFKNDEGHLSTLKDIFTFFAYEDVRRSPYALLLDSQARVPVAEELNSAILVSLGKSSSAAIEYLIQQTEVLINDISMKGGAGALINVKHDFLR